MEKKVNRRDFIRTLGAGAVSLALPGCLNVPRKNQRKGPLPNIVFILIDDLGWKDVGFMGSRYYETPNIDKLAREGMVFTNAYANAPNCAPTRACLMSGQYSPRHGVYTVDPPERGPSELRKLIPSPNKTELESGNVIIAETLKSVGYTSACIGKWHLGNKIKHSDPVSQGFDVEFRRTHKTHKRGHFGPTGEYLTDRLTDEAIGFIEANRNNPFFLYLSHYAVHTPIQAKQNLTEKYKKKQSTTEHNNPKYAAMIQSVDEGVGRIMSKLDESGLADNTIVIFFSDNGGFGRVTSMSPLRGMKGTLYEGGIRVPMIVRFTDRVKPGSKCDIPVIGIDFYPTLLELTGASPPAGQILDGESLMPLIEQSGTIKRRSLFWHFPAYLEAYQGGKSKGPWRTTPVGAVRQGNWKLMEFFEDGRLELYNLKDDIGERNNLVEKMPAKADELYRIMVNWRKRVKAPVPTEMNPLYNPTAKTA